LAAFPHGLATLLKRLRGIKARLKEEFVQQRGEKIWVTEE
jgi:hypothetical protein